MTRLKQATRVLIAVPAALAIASCSATEDTTAETSAATPEPETVTQAVTEETTVTEATSQQPTTEVGNTAATSAGASASEGDCATLPTDPRQQYATGTAPGRMPAENNADTNYWIEDIDNHYDPCAPLSWIIFRGSLGDERGPAGTGASITDGIAFYVNGKPDGEMRTFTRIENVELTGPNTVAMTWGERTGATAAGITAHYSVTLEADPGGMQAIGGEVLEFTDRWYSAYGMYMLGTYD